jgi:segregation and condensation protein B
MNKEALLEGLLFISGSEGLNIDDISKSLNISKEESLELINQLKESLNNDSRGIQVIYLGNNYKLATKEEHKDFYKDITIKESTTLSDSALETLAIVAYNSPITRSMISDIRGVDSSYIIRKLQDRGLITEIGRSELPGRPILLGVTDKFLDYFNLKTIDDLPPIIIEESSNEETDLFIKK